MTSTLYGQAAQSPEDVDTGSNGTLGLHFTVSAACHLDGIWFYSPSGSFPSGSLAQLPSTIALYTTQASPASGTLVTSNAATWLTGPGGSSAAAGSGWVFAAFTSPPALTAGTNYMAAAFRNDTANAWFSFTTSATWPLTSSPAFITAPNDVSPGQGWFNSPGTALAFPSSQNAGFSWFMDVQVSTAASRTASASLTVTPSFSAVPSARQRSASLTVTPSFSAAATGGAPTFSASASLTVTPAFSAAAQVTRPRSASLTVTPSFTVARTGAHFASASLTVTPSFSAAPHAVHFRTASLTITPVLTASASSETGAQPGYPGSVVDAKVELLLGTTWTDVTDSALPDGRQYGSIKSGQPDGAQQPSPSAMNLILDNPDYDFSPRNSASPYAGQLRQNTPARVSVASVLGTRLRLENDDEDMASVADATALHITGSMEIRLGVVLSDWRPCTLAARNGGTTSAWALSLNNDGTLLFAWRDSGGTLRSVQSPAAAGVSWRAFRVTLDASNGNVQFYLSTDIDGTWTSMGDAASGTSGAATSVRAGDSPLTIGWNALTANQMRGTVTAFRLYDGLADDSGTVVADAGFAAQLPGTTTWTDTAGRDWTLSGGAEISARDYRMHGELSSLNPTAHQSGGMARLNAQLSGRLRRLQQGAAPSVDSAMKRAVLSQTGTLFPVGYWPMEDSNTAKTFGAAVGSTAMTAELGTVKAAADSSFEASAALPVLGADQLSVTVDTYAGATAWAVRFLCKLGQTLPASGSTPLVTVTTTGGAVKTVQVDAYSGGGLGISGKLANGSSAFDSGVIGFAASGDPRWYSVEATTTSGGINYALVTLVPGASTGSAQTEKVTTASGFGNVTGAVFNSGLALDDTVIGHVTVQKAWTSLFDLGKPLNAWRTELAADRFARVCAEQSIPCRILGRPSSSAAMGPQPRGSTWTVLKDCAQTEQSIIYETRDCFGLGFRTRESLGAQTAAVTLDFDVSDLQGDLQPQDDDSGFLNDVTGSMPTGETWRSVLDDGSANSVSEPADGGRGRYAGSVPYPLNVSASGSLPSAVAFYLGRVSVDEPRYRNVVMDLGIPGAPAEGIARLRPGDLVKVTNVPGIYQDSDIEQLAMSFTETFGPGRKLTCDCIPASPYSI